MWFRLAVVALLAAGALACEDRSAKAKGAGGVVTVKNDDPQMAAAMAKAQETLPQFISALQLPSPSQTDFMIKVGFTDEAGGPEYMSVTPVTYDGTRFNGKLHNEPVLVRSIKLGDAVSVEPSRVVDWMYIDDGKMVGGYTLRVLRDRMTPEQRRRFDESQAFKIE
jgi:uncharacterized protein YegJ (DUF2314 family)